MPFWSRIANLFRGDNLSREIDEELQAHLADAIETGRDPAEAHRAFGSPLRHREQSRDVRLIPWLDSLRADAIFGWRQLWKRKVTSAAAILSLALGMGACLSAFRLIDALLLRPLPIADPGQLYAISRSGAGPDRKAQLLDYFSYPAFRQMQAAAKNQARLIALSDANPLELTFGSYQDTEEPGVQYVSGAMFAAFGLKPALGRLLTEDDDLANSHPCAVIAHDYWTRKFGRDPNVIGRTFHLSGKIYEIIGVGPDRFTGTEPGTVTDVFLATSMFPYPIDQSDVVWLRVWGKLSPGVPIKPVRDRLSASFHGIDNQFHGETLLLEPAAAGAGGPRNYYRLPLLALSTLVGLVLFIACANVANLMAAQAAARGHEMALRVSIGAGRGRLVQLVLVESSILGCAAAALGGFLAWWTTPFIVSLIQPVRLFLPLDHRVLAFGAALTLGVTLLFGLAPSLRASAVKPSGALKGGEQSASQRGWMHALVALQAVFCCFVLFIAGLFVATFDRLANQPNGFSWERLLILNTVSQKPQPADLWDQLAQHLRAVPSVESAGLSSFPLLQGSSWVTRVSIDGGPPSQDFAFLLSVSPGWAGTMRIPLLDGRDFLPGDSYPGAVIVNPAFANRYFGGGNPIGKLIDTVDGYGKRNRSRIVGQVGNARYRNIREKFTPTIFLPMRITDAGGALTRRSSAAVLLRTTNPEPLTLAPILRDDLRRLNPEFRVSSVRTGREIVDGQTVRERLLALLARFFALVALLLAGVGLYGVLDYTVFDRRREIGIRMALGARAAQVARGVTFDVFTRLGAGALAGLALGVASARYIASLLYQVQATDIRMLALPLMAILAAAALSALPAIIRAVRTDPASTLRAE
jgi:predicted permease